MVTQKTSFLKSSFLALYALSWAGFIFSKLPFISKYSGVLKLVIGRTTFWALLAIFRKAFIVMNAVIGVWVMFKVTGWSQGSFFMSAAALGSSYMEFFVTFVYKVYYWLFNIMDSKVVPNIPSNSIASQFNGWNIRPMSNNKYLEIAESAKTWYQPMHPTSASSWSDWLPSWKTIFYIGAGLLTLVALYTGYIYLSGWIYPIDKGKGPEINIETPGGSIHSTNSRSVIGKIGDILIFNRLNNLSEMGSYVTQKFLPYIEHDEFMSVQRSDLPTSQKYTQYWPYTAYDPSGSFTDRLKMRFFAEAADAKAFRLEQLDNQLANEAGGRRGEGSSTGKGKGRAVEIELSPLTSPAIKGWGLAPNAPPVPHVPDDTVANTSYPKGLPVPLVAKTSSYAAAAAVQPGGFMEKMETAITAAKLGKLPTTPNTVPIDITAVDNAAANVSNSSNVNNVSDLSASQDANANAAGNEGSDSSDEEEEGPKTAEELAKARKIKEQEYLKRQAQLNEISARRGRK